MRWTVEGAERETGSEHVIHIDADSREDAEAKAASRGLLVSNVQRSGDGATLASLAGAVTAARRGSGRARQSPSGVAPDYAGLRVASFVLGVFAGLAYVVGGVAIAMAIIEAASGRPAPYPGPVLAIGGLAECAAGAVLHGMSAGCLALRDLARNSFHPE